MFTANYIHTDQQLNNISNDRTHSLDVIVKSKPIQSEHVMSTVKASTRHKDNYLNNTPQLDFWHNGYKGEQDAQKDATVSMLQDRKGCTH